ncbi:MAG: nuclease [Phototrophicales bacterium]|nr:MAG: nuclease [Phototrophicales bacterium]
MATDRPFADLPAALVDEVLNRTQDISKIMLAAFQEMRSEMQPRRQQLEQAGLLKREGDLQYVPIPTTSGIDGAFAIERLLATDLVAAAAVAVEGITPPSETRHWPDPYHHVLVEVEHHNVDTGTIARASMIGMELNLATSCPHQVVFIDGSLTTPLIFFNQALNRIAESPDLKVSQYLLEHIEEYLLAYKTILKAERSDKAWVAIPKYTTRREFGKRMSWPKAFDDRAMLTGILQAGEFTTPSVLEKPERPWHLNVNPTPAEKRQKLNELAEEVTNYLSTNIRVMYYRPFNWLPALRLEMSQGVAESPGRFASVIHAVKHQCGTSAMMEPYPLYMADRMAKSLASAIPTFRQVTSQYMAETYQGDIGDVFLGLHGYRSETGR